MNEKTGQFAPCARTSGLVVRELADEVLVYDLERDEAHALNQVAGLVWRHCDGQTTVAEMADLLERELGGPVADDTVWYALAELGKDHLLEERASLPDKRLGMTRREMMLKTGIATAVVITSLAVPTAAMAASCQGCGNACASASSCTCTGVNASCTSCQVPNKNFTGTFCCAGSSGTVPACSSGSTKHLATAQCCSGECDGNGTACS